METQEPQERRTPDFDTAIPVGSSEAAELAERMQAGQMMQEGYAPRQSQSVVDDTAANEMIAEMYAALCNARANSHPAYEHWRVGEHEHEEVRDKGAPALKEFIPRRVLANSKKIRGLVVFGKHIVSKVSKDPDPDQLPPPEQMQQTRPQNNEQSDQ